MAVAIIASFSLVMAFSIHMLRSSPVPMSRDKAALIARQFGLFAVVGKFSYGLLANRFPGQLARPRLVVLPLHLRAALWCPTRPCDGLHR